MTQLARRASIVVVLLLLASVSTAPADCTCVSLRTFMPEERGRFEEQYMPQQFWDLRSCVADTGRLPRPTAVPDTVDPRGPKAR